MSYDYGPIAATAARLLTRFGRTVYLRSTNQVGGEPWSPALGQVDVPVIGIIAEYTLAEFHGIDRQSTDIIPDGEQLAILDATAVPTVAQKLVDGGVEMEIVRVSKAAPGNTPIVYFCQVRR